jgi:hypothetical protein
MSTSQRLGTLQGKLDNVLFDGNSFKFSGCLFLVVVIVTYIQTITDLNKNGNKTLTIITLIVNVIITIIVVGNALGFELLQNIEGYFLPMFLILLGISFTLALTQITDKNKDSEDKVTPVVTLIIDSLLILLVSYHLIRNVLMG